MPPIYCVYLFLIISSIENLSIAIHDLEAPQIVIKNGRIEGTWKTSSGGRQYASFEGIPYAKPPIGELRFKEPQPNEPWLGIWKADRIYYCPQVTLNMDSGVFGEEDCLYLNVFVPQIEKSENLDVLVHIHGGGYYAGNSVAYIDPKHLMDRNWIFVTMNYRLGALGFLSTQDDVVSGNNGLKDQSLALKWIQENIANFGGNPNSVTITGFSAGAASTHFHYFSPWSKGLFHKGWSFSGSTFNPWAMVEDPLQKAQELSKALGCDVSENKKMVDCLRQRPASLIVKKTIDYMHPFAPLPFCPFAPVIEKGSSRPFLVEHPYKILEKGQVTDVPWIASTTSEDALFVFAAIDTRLQIVEEKWTELAKYILDCTTTCPPSRQNQIAKKIREYYLSKDGKFNISNTDVIIKMLTDRYFVVDSEKAAQFQSKLNRSPVYYSKFSYEGANGWRQHYRLDYEGTCHGDDMVHYFGALVSNPKTEEDQQLDKICLDTLFSYARTGTPIVQGVSWTPIGDEFVYLNVSGPGLIQMMVKDDFSANQFWKNLNLLENEHLFKQKEEL